ncbi:unnamed protein product, partial [Mesorhabditis spiculigera]
MLKQLVIFSALLYCGSAISCWYDVLVGNGYSHTGGQHKVDCTWNTNYCLKFEYPVSISKISVVIKTQIDPFLWAASFGAVQTRGFASTPARLPLCTTTGTAKSSRQFPLPARLARPKFFDPEKEDVYPERNCFSGRPVVLMKTSIFLAAIFTCTLATGSSWTIQWAEPKDYPDPRSSDYPECRMNSVSSVCDPTGEFPTSDCYRLNNALKRLSFKPDDQDSCDEKGIDAMLAISAEKGRNQSFADELHGRWKKRAKCHKFAVFFFDADAHKLYLSNDSNMDKNIVEAAYKNNEHDIKGTDMITGLLKAFKEIETSLADPGQQHQQATIQKNQAHDPKNSGNRIYGNILIVVGLTVIWCGLGAAL